MRGGGGIEYKTQLQTRSHKKTPAGFNEHCGMLRRPTISHIWVTDLTTANNMVFVRLRVPHTIESGFDHSLQLSQVFIPCALFFASIAGACLQLHVDTLLRDIKGLTGELLQKAYLASWMGHFVTETIRSLTGRF